MTQPKIPVNLKFLLDRTQLSQNELARVSGVPQPTIQRILAGESANPSVVSIFKLATALGVSIDQLTGYRPLPGLDIPEADDLNIPKPKFPETLRLIMQISAADQSGQLPVASAKLLRDLVAQLTS